ncbi:hypothetical protein PC119_g15049 [Phytophthora cactorum]|nr:hypothetical protein PC119_g15049 [Phytophthora cactorum]
MSLSHEAIKAESSATTTCDAKDLQLFLAKKDGGAGAWLTEKDVKEGVSDSDTSDLELLDVAGAPLNLVGLSVEDVRFQVTKEDVKAGTVPVHVLVMVPDGAGGSASETSASSKMIKEIHAETVLKKRTFAHSQVSSSDWGKITNELNIEVVPVATLGVAAGEGAQVDPFDWARVLRADQEIALTEEQQRKAYIEYVESNIGSVLTEKELCVYGAEKKQTLLSVRVPGHDIEFVGTTDLLILRNTVLKDPSGVLFLPGVQMLIEVKKKVEPRNNFQALSELVALDLRANGPVMALLTDLNKNWVFFWVADKKSNSVLIHRVFIDNPGDGFEVIKTILRQSSADSDAEIEIPYFECPLKRLKLRSALPIVTEGGESGGIRESIERYYDISSMLGPDIDMARAVAMQVTRSIPALSYFS